MLKKFGKKPRFAKVYSREKFQKVCSREKVRKRSFANLLIPKISRFFPLAKVSSLKVVSYWRQKLKRKNRMLKWECESKSVCK